MYRCRLLVCLLIVYTLGIAQENNRGNKKISFRKQLKATTKAQINQLKSGALLVSLKTKKPQINALRKIGKNEQANLLENKQAKINSNIIAAFKAKFNFCPTYFFFSDYAIDVMDHKFNKVVFLNDSLQPDSNIKFESKTFLVAAFTKLQQDTAKHFSHYTLESEKNFSSKRWVFRNFITSYNKWTIFNYQ